LKRFQYTGDERNFQKSDYHNPLAFEWLMLDNVLFDDCDGFGMAMLKGYHQILKIPKKRIYRASCLTEEPNPEGHYVSWVRADDGIVYQLENRVGWARTLRYMRDVVGYTYWDYSSMEAKYIKKDVWMKAEGMVTRTVNETPMGLTADLIAMVKEGRSEKKSSKRVSVKRKPKRTKEIEKAAVISTIKGGAVGMFESVKYINLSKSLMTAAAQGLGSLGVLAEAVVNNRGPIIVGLGAMALLFAVVHWYNRGVTTKSLKTKSSINE